jgi:hypothetical protein
MTYELNIFLIAIALLLTSISSKSKFSKLFSDLATAALFYSALYMVFEYGYRNLGFALFAAIAMYIIFIKFKNYKGNKNETD